MAVQGGLLASALAAGGGSGAGEKIEDGKNAQETTSNVADAGNRKHGSPTRSGMTYKFI